MRRLEFWPDYGGVLLHEEGVAVSLDRLGAELRTRGIEVVEWEGYWDDEAPPPG